MNKIHGNVLHILGGTCLKKDRGTGPEGREQLTFDPGPWLGVQKID